MKRGNNVIEMKFSTTVSSYLPLKVVWWGNNDGSQLGLSLNVERWGNNDRSLLELLLNVLHLFVFSFSLFVTLHTFFIPFPLSLYTIVGSIIALPRVVHPPIMPLSVILVGGSLFIV